jgi:hypothetical protein
LPNYLLSKYTQLPIDIINASYNRAFLPTCLIFAKIITISKIFPLNKNTDEGVLHLAKGKKKNRVVRNI